MASTYTPIATTTLGSNATITFSSIPNTYTDLRLVINGGISNYGWNMRFRYNDDSETNYSYTYISGDGSAFSGRVSNDTKIATTPGIGSTNNLINILNTIDIMNYSNTSKYKTCIIRGNDAVAGTSAVIATWRSTSAINSIYIYSGASNDGIAHLYAGTTATLYGIAAA
jgi:hypothetical protein